MTFDELRQQVNREFGLSNIWPKQYPVSKNTYLNVIRFMFANPQFLVDYNDGTKFVRLAIGPNNDIMFKGMELIISNELND